MFAKGNLGLQKDFATLQNSSAGLQLGFAILQNSSAG